MVYLVTNLANTQQNRQSVKFVKRLVTTLKVAEASTKKQHKIMTGQIASLLDL